MSNQTEDTAIQLPADQYAGRTMTVRPYYLCASVYRSATIYVQCPVDMTAAEEQHIGEHVCQTADLSQLVTDESSEELTSECGFVLDEANNYPAGG